MEIRNEKDSLGEVQVPKEAYFGSFTVRAQENFKISNIISPDYFRRALGIVKLAAAYSNFELKLLKQDQFNAIKQAAQEFIDGKFNDQFTLDIFQAGAGTSYNMNCNEIIANRANEIMGGKKGTYKFIHPNNHVNMAQSTNDVIPTATRIAALMTTPELINQIEKLAQAFEKHAQEHQNTLKVGRTHLMDAVPITIAQELDSYKEALLKSKEFIEQESENLKTLGIGGTALGTGINSHPEYKDLMIEHLSKILQIKFQSGKNLTEMTNNMNTFMNFSAALRSLSTNLLNIANDLKLMNMGPKAGISEITLPEVQPGSSIMPGKVNPSIPECIEMIAFQVSGNDHTIQLAAQRSQFQLNVHCPIIMYNLLQSIQILSNGCHTLTQFSIKDLKINKERIAELFDNSVCTATALAPILGYQQTAEVIKSAIKNNRSIKAEVLSKNLIPESELEEILSVEATTKPRAI